MEHGKSFAMPSYEPSEKRFEISRDELSRERLRVVKEIYEKLSQFIPARIAISLYGSLSKGRELATSTAPSSDIDLVVYINRDDLMNNYEQWQVTDERFKQLFQETAQKKLRRAQAQFRNRQPEEQITLINPKGERTVVTIKQYLDQVSAEPVWSSAEKYILELIDRYLSINADSMGYTGETNHIYVAPLQFEGSHSIMNTVTELDQALDRNEKIADSLAEELAHCFALDVGGGLRPYREHFLKQLQAMADQQQAQRLWKLVDSAVREQERGDDISPKYDRQFPNTLEDALRYYGIGSEPG